MHTYMKPRFTNLKGYAEATATKATTKEVVKVTITPVTKKAVKNDCSLLILVAGIITVALGLRLATLFF